MVDSRIKKFAKILVHYSIGAKEKEEVLVSGSYEASSLVRLVYEELITVGAYPRVKVSIPGIDYAYYAKAQEHQLDFVSDMDYLEANKMAAMISIESDYNTKELTSIDSSRITRRVKARQNLKEIILKRVRWNVTLFPTQALAQDAEMSLQEYEDFVFGAVFADREDPVRCWDELSANQERLCQIFSTAEELRILGKDTDLTMKVSGRKFINSNGHYNMPSGEIFSAPIEDSVQGHIRFEYPVCLYGKEVEGVQLTFENGKVTKLSASKNQDFLESMLTTDAGAKYLGEIGIGNNFGITKFTKNILFDEKIGGSVHIALGQSYEECGGKNESAIHWDMIKDLRTGGEMYLDGVLVQKDGKFLL
ncbi:MAG: aminopeptidase [Candidatus Margulisiibacteriota bacterium]|nr:MAG: hypothetical protein A2X43_03730 [Candidatus Margulisbacteria bacterium GWD2_39_127]OGI02476.1 MAG: hypothetical protein A2X42_07315 [Candidatus Margulisbacteria bacterium GWF2_38_17]OGI10969.1 MAG: hypothetical protein A2X41_01840 [Candidatus Margulisbacteria bacterium GWE2_39_32]PZM83163.1 MAG: aminopeptidase [Candidatus Margulisiibacteriota bacterium]HAR62535.1 aminopeptidase [Candidatus Margulisiibacteriota bacterium]